MVFRTAAGVFADTHFVCRGAVSLSVPRLRAGWRWLPAGAGNQAWTTYTVNAIDPSVAVCWMMLSWKRGLVGVMTVRSCTNREFACREA